MAILKLELFSLASIIFVAICLFLTHRFVKENKRKYFYLASASICVLLHYSAYIIEVIKGTAGDIPNNLILPQWPCNFMMWLVLIIAILNFFGDSIVLKYYLYISSWVGALCALFGLCINFNFLDYPYFSDYDILKGLLSHVFLLYCTLYPFVEGKVKYNFFRVTLSAILAGIVFIYCANYSVYMLKFMNKSINTMLESPFSSMPWFNLYVILPLVLVFWFGFATIFELIHYKKGNRWFNRLNNIKNELKGD